MGFVEVRRGSRQKRSWRIAGQDALLIACRQPRAAAHANDGRRGIGGQRLVRADFSGGKGGFYRCSKRSPNKNVILVQKLLKVIEGRRAFFGECKADKVILIGNRPADRFRAKSGGKVRAEHVGRVNAAEPRKVTVYRDSRCLPSEG